MQVARLLRKGCEIGDLGNGQFLERLGEILLRRRRHPVGVLAEEDLVEIEFQDLILAQRRFETRRQDDLLDLALTRAVARQEEVLHHLLGDGRCPAQSLALCRIVDRDRDAARVEAAMLIEVLVLGTDEGILDRVRDLVDRCEDAAFAGEFVHHDALAGIDAAQGRRLVAGELRMIGKVLSVEHEDRHEAHDGHQRSQRDPAEEKPEDVQNETKHSNTPKSCSLCLAKSAPQVKSAVGHSSGKTERDYPLTADPVSRPGQPIRGSPGPPRQRSGHAIPGKACSLDPKDWTGTRSRAESKECPAPRAR